MKLNLRQISAEFKCALWNMLDRWMDANASHILGNDRTHPVYEEVVRRHGGRMAPFSGGHDFIVRGSEGGEGRGGMREKMEGSGLAKFSPNDRSNGSDDGPGIEMECFIGRQ